MNECLYAADVVEQAAAWLEAGRGVALATIVAVNGSSSRPLGARMACREDGVFVGAVSGGCVETDVARAAREAIAAACPRLVHYGRVDDPLLEVGLNCDGEIDVLIEPLDASTLADRGRHFYGVAVTEWHLMHHEALWSRYPSEQIARGAVQQDAPSKAAPMTVPAVVAEAWASAAPRAARHADRLVLAEPFLPAPDLLIFGAGPVAEQLAALGAFLGYRAVVSDPRENRFTPRLRADTKSVIGWPAETFALLDAESDGFRNPRTYVVSLEHEPRFEDALWKALMERSSTHPKPVYIGAIGKAQRVIEREARAKELGLRLDALQPIHTPVGLDIGGKSAQEIALSIAAQIVATVHGRPGNALSRGALQEVRLPMR